MAGAEHDRALARSREMFAAGTFGCVEPDPAPGGGWSALQKIAGMAEAFGVRFGPRHGTSGAGVVANLHVRCALANSGHLESMDDPGFWNSEGFQAGFRASWPADAKGYAHAPQAPGSGAPWECEVRHKLQGG